MFGGVNHNVKLAIATTFLGGMSNGIWGNTVLSGYLYVLKGDNSYVGFAEGIQGTAQALAALPSGYLADCVARDRVLLYAGIVGFLAVGLTYISLWWSGVSEYGVMCCALGFWGVQMGIMNPPLEALYADSVPAGERSKYNMYKFMARVISRASGPFSCLLLFHFLGDDWTLPELRKVFWIGAALYLGPSLICFMYDDSFTIYGRRLEEDRRSRSPSINEQSLNESTPLVRAVPQDTTFLCWKLGRRHIPYFTASADCIFGLASGMTIKFFPLFFKNETGLSPGGVSAIYTITPLFLTIFCYIAQRTSYHIGRVQTALLAKSLGVILLFLMAYLSQLWTDSRIMLPIYIIRTAAMNCSYPLMKSVLNDNVPRESRGKWNALESVATFGWSGSAALGGVLIDKTGYGGTFIVTALVQLIGVLVLTPLLLIVPLEKSDENILTETEADASTELGEQIRLVSSPSPTRTRHVVRLV